MDEPSGLVEPSPNQDDRMSLSSRDQDDSMSLSSRDQGIPDLFQEVIDKELDIHEPPLPGYQEPPLPGYQEPPWSWISLERATSGPMEKDGSPRQGVGSTMDKKKLTDQITAMKGRMKWT
ncbi:MAG: hypothetical protein GY696_17430 [Gammaproteobacteria bacterium]|nr:hypothetical protein [Gammaproteobacteria bacterium]